MVFNSGHWLQLHTDTVKSWKNSFVTNPSNKIDYWFLGVEQVANRQQLTVFCWCYYNSLLTKEEQKSMFETFYQLNDHKVQNRYLRTCIQKKGSDDIH